MCLLSRNRLHNERWLRVDIHIHTRVYGGRDDESHTKRCIWVSWTLRSRWRSQSTTIRLRRCAIFVHGRIIRAILTEHRRSWTSLRIRLNIGREKKKRKKNKDRLYDAKEGQRRPKDFHSLNKGIGPFPLDKHRLVDLQPIARKYLLPTWLASDRPISIRPSSMKRKQTR